MLPESRWGRIAVGAIGVLYAATGLAQLLAPQWFYDAIGHFPPFNRHYVGDLGAFTLPLGLGLLWAARAPRINRLLIGVAALASGLHSLNHLYDDWLAGAWTLTHLLSETLPLLLVAVLLAVVWRQAGGPAYNARQDGHV